LATGCNNLGWVGDGVCDHECNNNSCNFDGGDCKEEPARKEKKQEPEIVREKTGRTAWGPAHHNQVPSRDPASAAAKQFLQEIKAKQIGHKEELQVEKENPMVAKMNQALKLDAPAPTPNFKAVMAHAQQVAARQAMEAKLKFQDIAQAKEADKEAATAEQRAKRADQQARVSDEEATKADQQARVSDEEATKAESRAKLAEEKLTELGHDEKFFDLVHDEKLNSASTLYTESGGHFQTRPATGRSALRVRHSDSSAGDGF
jgi:hypothetical protein